MMANQFLSDTIYSLTRDHGKDVILSSSIAGEPDYANGKPAILTERLTVTAVCLPLTVVRQFIKQSTLTFDLSSKHYLVQKDQCDPKWVLVGSTVEEDGQKYNIKESSKMEDSYYYLQCTKSEYE